MDIVRSMLSDSTIYLSLWMHALKIAAYLLNTLSKAAHKTPYEM